MIKFYSIFFSFFLLTTISVSAQTQQDTIYTYYSKTPVVIDGSDADACWATATWHAIDQVWIPAGEVMAPGDFEGKYKVAWDRNYLYILVEIVDDSLSDVHKNPFDNYWNDDAVELFIDEDRSKGNHLNDNNAFAYHVSIFYDAIDGGINGNAVNCKDNMTVKMDTIGVHTYRWEFAVKMYNASFNINNPEASRVYLTANKLMGFSIAYCDNDGGLTRDNFIGSMIMPKGHENDNYITADYFGSMLLVDPDHATTSNNELRELKQKINLFPNPANDQINISDIPEECNNLKLEILNITGSLVRTIHISGTQQTISIADLKKGIYFFNLSSDSFTQSERVVKK